jgi:hypothetical protein
MYSYLGYISKVHLYQPLHRHLLFRSNLHSSFAATIFPKSLLQSQNPGSWHWHLAHMAIRSLIHWHTTMPFELVHSGTTTHATHPSGYFQITSWRIALPHTSHFRIQHNLLIGLISQQHHIWTLVSTCSPSELHHRVNDTDQYCTKMINSQTPSEFGGWSSQTLHGTR